MRLTASKLDLAVHCLHWVTLDIREPSGPAAQFGTRFHSLAARYQLGQPMLIVPDEELRVMFEGWVTRWPPLAPKRPVKIEPAYALNLDGTVSFLGELLERDYSGARPGAICGTLDVQGSDKAIDFKTGKERISAQDAWQLKFGAVVTGLQNHEFHYVDRSGLTLVKRAEFSGAQRAAFRDELIVLGNRLARGDTAPQPGEHCQKLYCPARAVCPALKPKGIPMTYKPSIQTGFRKDPLFLVLHGMEGVGKSSFAANAPKPIFCDVERKGAAIGVDREQPKSWADVVGFVDYLRREKHEYKSFVLDTADAAEILLHAHICGMKGAPTITEVGGGFGKGERQASEIFATLIDSLDALRFERGMHVIVLAHSNIRTFSNPEGADYDRWEMKLHKLVAAQLRERSTACLFARFEVAVKEDRNKARGISSGERVVSTVHNAAWDAKNTLDLPETFPLEAPPKGWNTFAGYVKAYYAKRTNETQAA